jgi:hypothetical protein
MIDEGDFARHIRRMNGIYRERQEMRVTTIIHDFADHLELIPSMTESTLPRWHEQRQSNRLPRWLAASLMPVSEFIYCPHSL